jgi:hypothetical protein
LIAGNTLSLTKIGRHLPGKAKVKHKIKRVDRFIGNQKLHDENTAISAAIARRITACLPSCVIAIDWSGCCSQDFHVLRASLVYDGRGLPLLNRVVSSERQEHNDEHQQFLLDLQALLGTQRRVVIVTDAGFKTPWLRQVRALGWEFVGRVRGRIYGKLDSEQEWHPATGLTQHASATPEALGSGQLGKSVKRRCSVYFINIMGQPRGDIKSGVKSSRCIRKRRSVTVLWPRSPGCWLPRMNA